MATKERTGGRLLRFPRGDQVNVSRRAFLGLAEAGVGFLLGAVLAGAELFGLYAPFGVAAVAAAGSGLSGFCTLAGTCLGYLCLEGMTDGMRYAASAVLTYSVAFAFYDTKAYRRGWFMPAIAMLLCALTGIITRGGQGWHGEDLVYFLTEVLFTGAAAYGYRVVFKQWPETLDGLQALAPRQTVGLLLLGGTVLMSLARVEVLATFSLGRLAAAVGGDAGGPPGGGGRRPHRSLRRGGPGPGLRGGPLLQPGPHPGGAAVRPVPGPAKGLGRPGLCPGGDGGSAVDLGRGPAHGPAPGGGGGGHPLPGTPPSACPRGGRRPPPPRGRTGRPAARPSPGRWGRWPGPFTPSAAA